MLKNGLRMVLLLLIMSLIFGCQSPKTKEQDLMRMESTSVGGKKKVILIVVDSLMAHGIDQGMREKTLPTIQFLIEHGQYYKDLVSSFPTMSVTIDSSLITGKYPDAHHIPGLVWYDTEEKKMINYGTGPMEIYRHGINNVLENSLINLNGKHLNKKLPTIYEDISRLGLKSGSVNGLIYRGNTEHILSIPSWAEKITALEEEIKVQGPDFMTLGSLSNPLEAVQDLPDNLIQRMGMNNDYSIEVVKYLIQSKKLPDFLLVYLPDLDQQLHKKGPTETKGIKELDQQLESLLLTFGSREQALDEAVFIILGDSGMTGILPTEQNPVIELPDLLTDLNVLPSGEQVTEQTEIVLAVNETMAYIYKLKDNQTLGDIANILKKDDRIDFIAWKEQEWIHVMQGGTSRELSYQANGELTDKYEQKWTMKQDLAVLDIKVNDVEHTLEYGQYPDVLRRLSGALHSHAGEFLVVTAKPGYELADISSPTHKGGGGHGSIREMESLVPLIIVGTDAKPQYLRIVDFKSFVLDLVTRR